MQGLADNYDEGEKEEEEEEKIGPITPLGGLGCFHSLNKLTEHLFCAMH
jgi:hypothetical protein